MTDIRIAYMNYDSFLKKETCHIVVPMDDAIAEYGLEAVIERSVPAGKDYIVTSKDELPQSRETRDKWVISNGRVIVGV